MNTFVSYRDTAGYFRPSVSASRTTIQAAHPPSSTLLPCRPPFPPSYGSHYEREKAHRYPLLPQLLLHHSYSVCVRERGGENNHRKNESGAKCERGLVSMPTAGGRTHAASQLGSLQDTCFCPSCFLSSPALPSRSLLFLSLSISGGDKTGPRDWY